MSKAIVYALAACLIWGLIFVVPQFMQGFSSFEVALGRFFFFGLISVLIMLKSLSQGNFRYPLWIWKKAFYFSLIATVIYYTCLVLSLRLASPAICALILGVSPISIAFYGNWLEKEGSFKSLIGPSLLILIGLLIINIPPLFQGDSPTTYLLGVGCALIALVTWTWYAVSNSRLLKRHPEVNGGDWATLMGVCTLVWVAVFGMGMWFYLGDEVEVERYFTWGPQLKNYLVGSAILGIFCSWVGSFLWNKACPRLSVSLAGQLTVFETLFGLLFVYIIEGHLPNVTEGIGMGLLLMGVLYGIRKLSRDESVTSPSKDVLLP